MGEQCNKIEIDKNMPNRILVVDINYLTEDYKDLTAKEIVNEIESSYDVRCLLVDSSRSNLQGNQPSNNLPVYLL